MAGQVERVHLVSDIQGRCEYDTYAKHTTCPHVWFFLRGEVAYFNRRIITLQYYDGFAIHPTLALKELIKI